MIDIIERESIDRHRSCSCRSGTEAMVARTRMFPMKRSRSNSAQMAKAVAPVGLTADDLAAIDGGNHFAGCTVPVVVKPICPPPPPPPRC
jgi:hypothetical protein